MDVSSNLCVDFCVVILICTASKYKCPTQGTYVSFRRHSPFTLFISKFLGE